MERNKIKVLIADNDTGILATFERQLAQYELDDAVQLVYAESVAEAEALIAEQYCNMAFVDLMFSPGDRESAGLSFINHLLRAAPSCVPVLMTAYVSDNFMEVARLTTSLAGGRTYLLNKTDEQTAGVPTFVKNFFARELEAKWQFEVPDSAIALLMRKGKRIDGMRAEPGAVRDEVAHLLFKIFDEPASLPLSKQEVKIELSTMQPGLSASITLLARPNYGLDNRGLPITGNRCVVKIGSRDGIRSEVERFNKLVKLGVPSEFRVELIHWAAGDTLAAVCYSFAGGSASDGIVSLDTLLESGDVTRAGAVIDRLFAPASKNWYSIPGPDVNMQRYYSDAFGTDFSKRLGAIAHFLSKQTEWTFDSSKARATFNGFSFSVPAVTDFGKMPYFNLITSPTCLVHGDMHGGNVLVDEENRTVLIDYATVGYGPRFADAAAALATLRLWSGAGQEDAPLASAAGAYGEEMELLRGRARSVRRAPEPWFALSQRISDLIVANFDDRPDEDLRIELALTSAVYAISIFGLPIWSAWQKMRLIAWIAAIHQFVKRA